MANLDTRSKRASSVNLEKSYQLALVLPDGAITLPDRQQSAWSYSGIAATTALFQSAWAIGINRVMVFNP